MESLFRDVRLAFRAMARRPAFAAVAVLSLALGIGANTAIFTVINAVFLHPLAIAEPSRVVAVFTRDTKTAQAGNVGLTPTSLQNYEDYRSQNTVFAGLAGFTGVGLQWMNKGQAEPLPGMMTTSNYFDVLGVRPALGRFFPPGEDVNTPAPVAVLSHSVWTNQFGSDPGIVGRSITLNGLSFTVTGVTQPGFKGTAALAGADRVWVPLGMRDQLLVGQMKTLSTNRRFRWINIAGRLKPGVELVQAQSAMKVIAAALERQYPGDNDGRTVELASISDAALGINNRTQFLRAGGVMMSIVGLVLVIACVNLANLLLAQSARREKDVGISAALGASRARLVRQLLMESVLLALAGGAAGLVVAYWGREALWAFRPPFLAAAAIDLSLDRNVLAFTASVSLLTGVVFGVVPAVKLSRTNLIDALKIGGRGGALGFARGRLRSVLVVSEIALATVALIGAGLFVRSLQAAQNADLGFDAKHIALVGLDPGTQRYAPERGQQLYEAAIAAARRVPGVKGAAVASMVPAAGGGGLLLTIFPEGQAQAPNARGTLIAFNDVSPGYFDTLRVPFLSGRDFNDFDREGTTPVAVINEAVARQLWPGQDPLHKRFTIVQETELWEVVGVVADSVIGAVGEDPTPLICRPIRQVYAPAVALVVRTAGDPAEAIVGLRSTIQTVDRGMPLRAVGTIQEQVEQGLWAPRMGAALLSIFGGLACLLAMIGIYGVMAYAVAQRTQEIGFRIAIGAQPRDVLRLVLGQGLWLVGVGTAAGVVVAVLLARLVAQLLFGIRPHDPVTLATVVSLLGAVAMLACYLPARRATRVDPLTALRTE